MSDICDVCQQGVAARRIRRKGDPSLGLGRFTYGSRPCCEKCFQENRDRSRRDWKFRRLYGITHEQYDKILSDQGGGCAICGTDDKNAGLCVDHCHTTGVVRGILCRQCNFDIGRFGDSAEKIRSLIERMVEYLESNNRISTTRFNVEV